MKKSFFLVLVMFFCASTFVFSQQSEHPVIAKFLVEGGVEYGGDEILKIIFTTGETQSMRAGQGGYLAAGGQFEFSQAKWLMLRASVGIKYNTTAAENANIRLTRVPLNLMPFWKINDDFQLGIGITAHQAVKLKGDGFVPDVDFSSRIAPRFEFGYRWFALTYSAVKYESDFNESYAASAIGFSASFTLPNKSKSE
jgi:hypothetical protein